MPESKKETEKTNNVYKVPRSAFLKLWNTVHHAGGSLNDLLRTVQEEYDPIQRPNKTTGELPVFDTAKCKAKCDRIIAWYEARDKPAPPRLPGHESLAETANELKW